MVVGIDQDYLLSNFVFSDLLLSSFRVPILFPLRCSTMEQCLATVQSSKYTRLWSRLTSLATGHIGGAMYVYICMIVCMLIQWRSVCHSVSLFSACRILSQVDNPWQVHTVLSVS